MIMEYSVCLETFFHESDFLERIPRVVENGFSRIEFWDHRTKNIDAISKLVGKNYITISTFSGHRRGELFSNRGFQDYREEIVESIKIAKRLKASGLMILSQGLNPDGSGLPIPADYSYEMLLLIIVAKG